MIYLRSVLCIICSFPPFLCKLLISNLIYLTLLALDPLYYNFVSIASEEKRNCNEDAVPLHVGAVALDSAHDL